MTRAKHPSQPKILLFDIETSPNIGYTWGKWEQNVIEFKQDSYFLSVAWKWLHDKKVYVKGLDDNPKYKPNVPDDRYLIDTIHKLFCEADVVIAHNGDQFDVKKSNTRFVALNYAPPIPYKTVDTKKLAKRYFKFDSNALDELARYLGIGRKVQHKGFPMWLECMAGDPKAWKTMKKYNKQDVVLLEEVYLKLRAWHTTHPKADLYRKLPEQCPMCGGTTTHRRGFQVLNKKIKQRWQCVDCARAGLPAWFNGSYAEEGELN